MNPREFCVIAGHLAARTEAAASRSAISRAYYSLFHVILQFMIDEGIRLPKKRPECHEKLYWLLYSSNDPDLQKIAGELNDLRSRRNDADYQLDKTDVEAPKTAQLLVMRAEKATRDFDESRQDVVKVGKAVSLIKTYARETLRLA